MPGKINNSAQLSKSSLLALQADRKEGVKTSSFWDKWSNLSTGQKWGRALAWIIPPLGVGIQAGANLWQARQAKAAAARPEESKVVQSEESVKGTPLQSHIIFGKQHRLLAQGALQPRPNEPLVRAGDAYPPELQGLAIQYAKDLNRDAEHTLVSSNGRSVQYGEKSENKNTALRDFFIQEFPAKPEKAEKWAVFASKFLSQSAGPGNLLVTKEIGKFSVSRDHLNLKLVLAEDGDSALLEVRAHGTPNQLPGIDQNQSTVDNFLLAKITLGPEEKLEVISGYSKHNLVAKADDAEESSAVGPTAADIAHQKSKEASRNFKSMLESRGITNADQAMECIRKCKTVAESVGAKDIKGINDKSLGGGNAMMGVFLENSDLLDSQKPLAERQEIFESAFEVPAQKQLESKLVSIEKSVNNGDIEEEDAQNMRMLSRNNIAINREQGKSLLNDLEFLGSFKSFSNAVRSNNLTNAESMQVIRAHNVLKSASEDNLEEIEIHLGDLFKGRALPSAKLADLEGLFPEGSS